MVLYDSRKKSLAEAFGNDQGCIVESSWMKATFQDLNDQFKVYSDDMQFLYTNREYCAEVIENTPTLLVVRERNGVSADIIVNNESIGKTNTYITATPGNYTGTVYKDGYVSQELAFTIEDGKTKEYNITLIKKTTTSTPVEYDSTTPVGAVLVPTMNMKGGAAALSSIRPGEYVWFGWEFKNTGDAKWTGKVGVRLYDAANATTIFQDDGVETGKTQSVNAGETKYLWAYVLVTPETVINTNTKVFARLTPT
jgi:hypothetical protein